MRSLFCAAGLDKAQWLEALSKLAEATGSRRAQLIGVGALKGVSFNWVTGISPEVLEQFEALDGGNPAVNPRVAAGLKAAEMVVVGEDDYDLEARTIVSPAYAEFVTSHDFPFGCQTNLIHRPDLLVGLAILRSRSEGRTTSAQRQLFMAVAPYARAATISQLALEGQAELVVRNTLEEVRAAIFLCDKQGQVRGLSPSARTLIDAGGPLALVGGQLSAVLERDNLALERSLARTTTLPHATAVLYGREILHEPVILDIFRMPGWTWSLGFSVHTMIVARTPTHDRAEISKVLMATQGAEPLTLREQTCLQLVSEGHRVSAIAERLGLASVTVELYLKSARRKLNAKTLPEAVAKAIVTLQIQNGPL